MFRFIILAILLPLTLTACNDKVKIEDDVIGEEAYNYAMPKDGKFEHPKHGKEEWFAYGAMSGVGDTPANGVVQGYKYEDGTSAVTMQLNINPTEEGSFYEAWLTAEEPDEIISIGHLTNYFGDSRHQLSFEADTDIQSKPFVMVTLESDDGNPDPSENLVAKGTLKVVKR
ncbi:anti-sigma factor [Patescibacteria group bacterium]|nr:anti-sigma factor [Patescibacteria group bacterium]MBU1123224.1 anti-sigma factor [Patescibacteria group bacterium]MBU1911359.1 anti-sigma factor [Patescibacteria group bacterium]